MRRRYRWRCRLAWHRRARGTRLRGSVVGTRPDGGRPCPGRHPARIAFVVVAGIALAVGIDAFVHRPGCCPVHDLCDRLGCRSNGRCSRRWRGDGRRRVAGTLHAAYFLRLAWRAGRILQGDVAIASDAAVKRDILGGGLLRREGAQCGSQQQEAGTVHGAILRASGWYRKAAATGVQSR